MKAFVIKNKEGEYLDNCQDFETNNICDAKLFDDYKEALSFSPKDCEPVEIEIQETKEKYFIRDITVEQLREENKELKEQLDEQIDYKDEYYHYWQETRKEIKQLKEQLEIYKKALRIAVANVGTADRFIPINRELDAFVSQIYRSNKLYMQNVFNEGKWINVDDAMYDYFIEQAKESLK